MNIITDKVIYNACEAMPLAKIKMFMLHFKEVAIALELNTPSRQLYFLSQVLYLSGEFIMQQDFEILYKIANDWKKHELNRLVDVEEFYGITRILSPTEHDLKSIDYLERLYKQATENNLVTT